MPLEESRLMRLKELGLNSKIALAVSALLIAAAIAISLWTLAFLEKQHDETLAKDATALASAMAETIDAKLRMVHASLIAVAATVPKDATEDYFASEAFLDRQVALHALFDNGLFIVATDGRLIGESPPRPARRGNDVSAREYFHKTIQTRKPYISKPYRSTHNPGQPALIMTAPIFDAAGKMVALLYGSMDLLGSNVLADLARQRIGETGYMFLTDGRDSVIAHPDGDRIMKPAPAPGQNELFDRAIEGYEGFGDTVTSRGVPTHEVFKRVKATGWILGINLPKQEFDAPVREARGYVLLYIAAGMLAVLLLGWLLIRRVLTPLSRMTRQVEAMVKAPDTSTRLPVAARSNEVGVLAAAFNAMLDKLAGMHDELEHRVAERTAELVGARDEAQRANRAKSDFLSAVSHDLRTPMNAILGFSQLLESGASGPLTEPQRAQVHEIRNAGNHLLALINDVLDLARIEAGKQRISIEPVRAAELIGECLSLMRPVAEARRVRLTDAAEAAEDYFVRADRTRLKQVMLNLLSNAIKYDRPGGGVRISCQRDAGTVRISVSDQGPGLTAQQCERLFEAFERLGVREEAIEGAGIGLTLSKRLVELMGGTIGVDSAVGKGSTFWVCLLRADPVEHPVALPPRAEPVDAPGASPIADPRTVLYIEDNPVNTMLMQAILSREPKLRLLCASLPEEGMAMAVAERPDLILLDIQLPGIDGYEVLRRLRADEHTRAIPVIAISANAMTGDVEAGLAAGFDAYLTKPLDIGQVLGCMRVAMHA
jgi:signal transduction histidine kinase/ActR/RegA family two-component response regulator